MRNALTIARREVGTYFTSPLIWILATAFLVFSGLIFALYISQPGAEASMAPLLGLYLGWRLIQGVIWGVGLF